MEEIGLRAVLGTTDFDKGTRKYLSGIAKMDSDTKSVSLSITGIVDDVGKSFTRVGSVLTTAVVAGAGAATLAIGGIIKSGVSLAADLEEQMSAVAAITQGSAEEIAGLRSLAIDLGVDPNLKVTALDAAAAIEVLAKNGLEADQIMGGAARASVTLSNATGTNLSNAADIATDAMVLFGIEAKDIVGTVDGITSVVTSSKFGIDDYRLGLGQAGAQFSALGFDIRDFNVALAATSANFTGGAQAGTGLKNFLLRLAPTTKTAKAEMQSLGIITAEAGNRFFDADGNTRSLAEISGVLQSALADLSDEQKSMALRTIFGNDAMGAAIGLANTGAEGFTALAEKMDKVDAGAQVAARVDNLNSAFEIMSSVLEGVGIGIGDRFLPLIRRITVVLTNLVADNQSKIVDFFGRIADGAEKVVEAGEKLADKYGPAIAGILPILGSLAAGFGTLLLAAGPALLIFGQLLSLGANIGSLVGSITPVIASMGGLAGAFGAAQATAATFLATVAPIALPILAVGAAIGAIGLALVTNFGGLRDLGARLLGSFLKPLELIAGFVLTVLLPALHSIVSSGFGAFESIVRAVGQAVGFVLIPAFDAISGVMTPLLKIAGAIAGVFITGIVRAFKAASGVVRFFAPIVGTIVGLFLRFNPVTFLVIGALQILGKILSFVVDVGTKVAKTIGEFLAPAFEFTQKVVGNFVKNLTMARDVLLAVGKSVGLLDFSDLSESVDGIVGSTDDAAEGLGDVETAMGDLSAEGDGLLAFLGDGTEANGDFAESFGDIGKAADDSEKHVKAVTKSFYDYLNEAQRAEDKTIDLNRVIIAGIEADEDLGHVLGEVTEAYGELNKAEVEATRLAADIQVERDRLTAQYKEEGGSITDVGKQLEDLFGERIMQVNAMLKQKEAEEELQALFENRVKQNGEDHNRLMSSVAGSYAEVIKAQKDLTANPFDEELIERAANAQSSLDETFGTVRDNYASFVFDLAQISQGAFTEESAALAIGLGTLTIEEADARLIQEQITRSLAPLQEQDLAIALGVAVLDEAVVGEDIDRLFNQVKEAAELGFSDVVDAVIETSITMAEEDGVIDTDEVVALIKSTDIAAAAGGAIEAEIAIDLAAKLDEDQASGLAATFDTIRATISDQAEQERAIDLAIELLLSGTVNEGRLQETFAQIGETVSAEGASLSEALSILVDVEADTLKAEEGIANINAVVADANTNSIEIAANADSALGTFALVESALITLDAAVANPDVTVYTEETAYRQLVTDLADFEHIDAEARARVKAEDRELIDLERRLGGIEQSPPTVAQATITLGGGLEALKRIGDVEVALNNTTDASYEAEVNISFSGDEQLAEFAGALTDQTNVTTAALQTTWMDTSTGITTTNAEMWTQLNEQQTLSAETQQAGWTASKDGAIASRDEMWTEILADQSVKSTDLQLAQEAMFVTLTGSATTGMANIVTEVNSGMDAFILTVNGKSPAINAAFVSTLTTSVSAMRAKQPSFFSTGGFLADGLAAGIQSRIGEVASAAAALVTAAVDAANSAGEVASPSRLTTRTGEFLGDGVVVGIDNRKKAAAKAAANMIKDVLKAANDALVGGVGSPRALSVPRTLSAPLSSAASSVSNLAPTALPSFLQQGSNFSTSTSSVVNNVDRSTNIDVTASYQREQSPIQLRHEIEAVLAFR